MANPDNSGCSVNFLQMAICPIPALLIGRGTGCALNAALPKLSPSKQSDHFQRGFLNRGDKPKNGGGQNKNDACLREGKIAS